MSNGEQTPQKPAAATPMRGPGRVGRIHGPVQKAKDFRGTVKRLSGRLRSYAPAIGAVLVLAVGGTIFSIMGPRMLGQATTAIFTGITSRLDGNTASTSR
jgi:ATP-binding cassette subfamily B protein